MVKVSVIVITYNRSDLLASSLKSILNQEYKGYELVVVDDGSIDKTKAFVKKLQRDYKNIRYFYQEHKGYSAARNLGLKKSKGDIILFTDDDCIVEKMWIKKILKRFKENPSVAAVGGSISPIENSKISWAHYILNFSSWHPKNKTAYIKDIPTANIAYKKKMIEGMYFPKLPKNISYEDSLFNFELIKQGKKILFDPSIRVYHLAPDSIESFLKGQKKRGENFLYGYKVHGFWGKLLVKIKILNIFCPRLILVGFRCTNTRKMFFKFVRCFPLIARGELERGLAIIQDKKPISSTKI